MKMIFRWYGDTDPIPLKYIRQIPCMDGIVSAIYDVPVGQAWPQDKIDAMKREIEAAGLSFEVIESVPVHEDIKLGSGRRDEFIDNYKTTIRRLGRAGIRCICYNFMPVFDWTRTQLDHKLADGSTALVCYTEQLASMDPLHGEISLPGWDASYKKDELAALFEAYSRIDEEKLWENLEYFLREIIPVAEESGIRMAIHPDDPPRPIFGLPRIITCEQNLDRLLKLVDSEANGLTFCVGSLGCDPKNDTVSMIRKYSAMHRVHFAHVRNVKLLPSLSFEESGHYTPNGSIDMKEIMRALKETGFDGYIRPDHGRMIWGETGKPGYGLYDRALGAMYLAGIWEAL